MNLSILYFASIKEAVNCERESFDCDDVATVSDLIQQLSQRGSNWKNSLQTNKVLVAVNQTISQIEQPLVSGDEVAFFPPVTGG